MSGPGLLAGVFAAADAALTRTALVDNVDPERFPRGMPAVGPEQTCERGVHLRAHVERWEWLAGCLDDPGRDLLCRLLIFHLVGHRHARVGPSIGQVRAWLSQAGERLVVERDVTVIPYAGSPATHRFTLAPLGYPIELESYMLGVQGTFQAEQYRSPTHQAAWPSPGDTAIDAGGCFGETALWLAHHVGSGGRVHTLEFAPANLAILRANLEANPQLAERITLTAAALWETGLASVATDRAGPASMLSAAPSGAGELGGSVAGDEADGATGGDSVRTVSLDQLVEDNALERVDFVKMDIEGAEPAALRGAQATLERWRPKLALAAYHDIDHLWQLPLALTELGYGYRFALGHFTMHAEETVIYGWVP